MNDVSSGINSEGSVGKDHDRQPPTERELVFDTQCCGSNTALEVTGKGTVVDFASPPSHKSSGTPVLLTDAGQLEASLLQTVDVRSTIVDPSGPVVSDPGLGPGSQNRGGGVILEFTDPSGKVAHVGIFTMSSDFSLADPDDTDSFALAEMRADLDGGITTYIVGPHGEVVVGKEGFSMPPPVTIGEPYSQVERIAAKASRPDVTDPERFAAFGNLGNVTKVILDLRQEHDLSADPVPSSSRGGANPFVRPIEAIKQDVKRRAAAVPPTAK